MATTTLTQPTDLDLLVKAMKEIGGCGIIVNNAPCADERDHNGDHLTIHDLLS